MNGLGVAGEKAVDWLNVVASWASIIGFGLTILLAMYTGGLRRQLNEYLAFKKFKADKRAIVGHLKGLIEVLNKDGIDNRWRADLFELAAKLKSYGSLLSLTDRWLLRKVLKAAGDPTITPGTKTNLTTNLSTLAGNLESKGDVFLG